MRRLLLIAMCVLVLAPLPAVGEIEVMEDEVIFMIKAPQATSVFLVGDFNNWNPTLEKMERIGDDFQSLLFMGPGVYHYKFVVDGEWVFDPDNRFRDEEKGSLLVLEDRSGNLVLTTEDYLSRLRPRSLLEPGVRYAAAFGNNRGDSRSDQALDLYVSYVREGMRAGATINTRDDRWQFSPFESGLEFNRGFLEAGLGKARLRAFENDSLWTSSDPFGLVGGVGVFDYNAGYERKGLSLELLDVAKTSVRAMVVDKLDQYPPRPMTVGADAFGGFAGGASADTTVYRYLDSADDADSWALEANADFGDWGLGYGTRRNRGLHAGLLVDAQRTSNGFVLESRTTRETWDADLVWGRIDFLRHFSARAGFAYSTAHLATGSASTAQVTTLGDATIGQDATRSESKIRFQTNKRSEGRLAYARGRIEASLAYQWSRYDFDPVFVAGARADVNDYRLQCAWAEDRWRLGGDVRYLDQRYGDTPGAMHYFTPTRNFWLDYDHKLDPANIVAFDLTRSTMVGLDFEFNPRDPFGWGPVEASASLSGHARAQAVMADVVGRLQHVSAVAGLERGIYRRFYGQVDGRLAWYDKPGWGGGRTYFAPYVEVGYRHEHVEASVGFGQDPVVLDPAINQYYGNGRELRLREAAFSGVTRDDAALLGERLRDQERRLEKDRTVKLEVILLF